MVEDSPPIILQKLENMGYFKFVPLQEKEYVKSLILSNLEKGALVRYTNKDEREDYRFPDYRTYKADNEDLAEGGIGYVIKAMQNVLEIEGVKIQSVKDETTNDSYNVFINDVAYPILTTETIASPDTWTIAFERLLEIVNELLQSANSTERLYGFYGGNDGLVILLTNELFTYIKSCQILRVTFVPLFVT